MDFSAEVSQNFSGFKMNGTKETNSSCPILKVRLNTFTIYFFCKLYIWKLFFTLKCILFKPFKQRQFMSSSSKSKLWCVCMSINKSREYQLTRLHLYNSAIILVLNHVKFRWISNFDNFTIFLINNNIRIFNEV